MRKIKFRQWDSTRNVMHHDIGAIDKGWNGCPILKFDENPLMQFTGLNDKNGKEIYEWDILCFVPVGHKEYMHPYRPFVVHWKDDDARFSDWSPRDKAEIIGNIYENPEMVEEQP